MMKVQVVKWLIALVSLWLVGCTEPKTDNYPDDGSGVEVPQPDPEPTPDPEPDPDPDPDPEPDPEPSPDPDESEATVGNILVFSKTAGFRHSSIPVGIDMLQNVANNNGWGFIATEDASMFNEADLAKYSVVVWLSTTGDVLTETQQSAFESYIHTGGGYLGIHAASDTEYNWSWYGDLVGAYFKSHPQTQDADINVEDQTQPATEHLPSIWSLRDEWYNFRSNPRAKDNLSILMSLDESSYDAGNDKMGDHPITWQQQVEEGRAFYTGLGHREQTFENEDFIKHITGALKWAGNLKSGTPIWQGAAPQNSDFQLNTLGSGLNLPMEMDISKQGRLFIIGRGGDFYALKDGRVERTSGIDTNSHHEGGLIGFALAPDFNLDLDAPGHNYAYFHYTDANQALHRVSRIEINQDLSLDLNSELEILTYPVQLSQCCHVAGSLDFDNQGNLFISTGDNTNPFASNGYSPIDERSGRSAWDAQKASSNTNDLRGKILRIKPLADGSYTIPDGNLFTQDELHRGEIYAMGNRNPFRIAVDQKDNTLIWADVGPDAGSSNPNRGPAGYDELNRTKVAGNFGWPYFAGDNEAYIDYNFTSQTSSAAFDEGNVVNDSPNNTGATNLPAAKPAWVKMSHRALMVAGVYRYDSDVQDEFKLPSYYDGKLIFWNFNNDKMYEADVAEDDPELNTWLDTSELHGIIDGIVSDHNNRLYLLSYGGNCCGSPAYAGVLTEVLYAPGADPAPVELKDAYFINAGGQAVTTSDSKQFSADQLYSGGAMFNGSGSIDGTDADSVYLSHRWQSGGFNYQLPLENGSYEVTLHFAETYFTEPNKRVFHVDAQGNRVLTDVDIVAAVGNMAAYEQTFTVAVSNELLTLEFVAKTQNPLLSGIEVVKVDGSGSQATAKAYLEFPAYPASDFSDVPQLLSATGAFDDVASLTVSDGLVLFEPISPLWSDNAKKQRWVAIPEDKQLGWQAEGKWQWPAGTVFIKQFDLPTDETDDSQIKRLETRFTIVREDGSIYGVTYKWRDDNSDAELLTDILLEDISLTTNTGSATQTWTYPGPSDCLSCHNEESTGVLGIKTASINSDLTYPDGNSENQLQKLNDLGLLNPAITDADWANLPQHAALDDTDASLEHRMRSYWDINCGSCHGPLGIASLWDARFETALADQGVVDGPLANQRDYHADYGLTAPKVVDPGNPTNSILYLRDKSINPEDRMPPLGRALEDEKYIQLLKEWIESLE